MNKTQRISILKLISDPSRYKIIQLLVNNGGNICVNEIAKNVSITPSAVSHQLSKLEEDEIVKPVRKGQNVCYKLTNNKNAQIIQKIIELFES